MGKLELWPVDQGLDTAMRAVHGGDTPDRRRQLLSHHQSPHDLNTPVLEEAQEYAEREIVARVEHVLPAYQVIRDRVNARSGAGV